MYYSYLLPCPFGYKAQYLKQRRRILYISLAWRTKIYAYFLGVKYVADVLRRFQPGYKLRSFSRSCPPGAKYTWGNTEKACVILQKHCPLYSFWSSRIICCCYPNFIDSKVSLHVGTVMNVETFFQEISCNICNSVFLDYTRTNMLLSVICCTNNQCLWLGSWLHQIAGLAWKLWCVEVLIN